MFLESSWSRRVSMEESYLEDDEEVVGSMTLRPTGGLEVGYRQNTNQCLRRASAQRMRRFAKICVSEDCEVLQLVRDVRTRWNSTHAMIQRAIKLKSAYQSMCRNEPPLRSYGLEDDEWRTY